MNSLHLVKRFSACRESGESLVLVTVYETLGSTYSKAGSRMLITAGGENQGLISGGCLESDLAERARRVLRSNEAATVTYDLRDEADELFGLGVGCNGLISVLLQPQTPETDYEPLASIAEALIGESVAGLACVIESNDAVFTTGASVVLMDDGDVRCMGVSQESAQLLVEGCRRSIEERRPRLVTGKSDDPSVLYAPLIPVPRILVLGAGLDAVPLVNVLAELGWRVTVGDHRAAYLERQGFARAEKLLNLTPESLAKDMELSGYDAIVVMSHHLATDREYLRQLAAVQAPFIGLLGPPARKQRLLEELGDDGGQLAGRLRGPVGIDIGADTAESIAVSIAADIQQVLVRDA